MNNTFSVEQNSRTGKLVANLILRQHNSDLMARLMEIRSGKPKKKQKEIAEESGYSRSSLQRYKQDITKCL